MHIAYSFFKDALMADSENESEDREESELIRRNKVLLQIAQKKGHLRRAQSQANEAA
jgi:hypothetical protein